MSVVRWLKQREMKLTAAVVGTTAILGVLEVIEVEVLGAVNAAVALWITFFFGPPDEDEG